MEILGIALTVLFTTAFLLLYKFVVNPQIVLPYIQARCPDRWTYNAGTGMCDPLYPTHCFPFDPDATTLKTPESRMNVARMCGTSWV